MNTREPQQVVTPEEFWRAKHQTYASKDFVKKPNWLARTLADNLEGRVRILDLGCGQGQDSKFLAAEGHDLVATDFSGFALQQFATSAESLGIKQLQLDIAKPPYPFDDGEFDVVYAHLSLHYFDVNSTRRVFAEISRILSPGGSFWSLFNSDHDPEASSEALRLEERYLELSPGDRKRYFKPSELSDLLGENFSVDLARYGHGTTKSNDDQYVELVAHRRTI